MKKTYYVLGQIILLILLALQVMAQQISFPGAEGAGRFTSGGRGTVATPTQVFEVTSLADNNVAGTLRYACSQSTATYPYRTIVFRVSGTIHLNAKLSIPRNTTIAGQTAPGGGICIADYPVSINGDNVIVRYLRIRLGDKNQLKTSPANCGIPVAPFSPACMPLDGSGGDDAFGDLGHKNLIIDHCSVSWSNDEALTFYRGDSLTLQWNLISEPLNYSYHFETGDADFENHGYGGIWGALHGSFHHNLFAHARNRTPRFGGNSTYPAGSVESADFRNNVLYNWGINNVYGGEGGQYNLVNNYYKYGPNTSAGVRYRIVTVDYSDAFPYASYYLSGNYVDGSAVNSANNWTGAQMKSGNAADSVQSKVLTPYLAAYLPANTQTAQDAYDSVLKKAGAILPARDTLDMRIINDVKNRTGKIIDVQGGYPHATPYAQTVDAWPNLESIAPPADTDHDGMPDSWETDNGLNPNDASDRGVFAPNGYTNLENYLNSIMGSEAPPDPTGDAATATWPLLTDAVAITNGSITAADQVLGSAVAGIQYGSSFGGIPGWQRAATTSYLPIGYNADTYVEYKLTPAANKTFTAKSIVLSALGGGTGTARMAIYYSLDNFATSFPAGNCDYNGQSYDATVAVPVALLNTSTTPLTGQQIATIPTNIAVASTQTLSVRVYAWITGTGNRYFPSQNVSINGTTADEGTLPVNLLKFSAGLENGQTKLHWQSANEKGMRAFDVERSDDGRVFTSIGTVAAKNAAQGNYSLTDPKALVAQTYYRLKMIGLDGNFSYSYIVSVKPGSRLKLSVNPNPANNFITVNHKISPLPGRLIVYNATGIQLMNINLAPQTTQTSFSIEQLPKGSYLVQYSQGSEHETALFIKQ